MGAKTRKQTKHRERTQAAASRKTDTTLKKLDRRIGQQGDIEPRLPRTDSNGNRPAKETIQIIIARQIIGRRKAAGWTQEELARQAGVRQETVSRLETGRHPPNVGTVDKIDRALKRVGV
jgi:DNA-binding XRE family transcriptional regulator